MSEIRDSRVESNGQRPDAGGTPALPDESRVVLLESAGKVVLIQQRRREPGRVGRVLARWGIEVGWKSIGPPEEYSDLKHAIVALGGLYAAADRAANGSRAGKRARKFVARKITNQLIP